MGFPVRAENSVIPWGVAVTILVPSRVSSVLRPKAPPLGKVRTILADARLVPGAVVSSSRMFAGPPSSHCWNSSVAPPAVQEKIWPNGLKLPIQPAPCQAQDRIVPVARVTTWIDEVDRRRSRASLVPSGDTAIPASWAEGIVSGTARRASFAVWVAESKASL
jgi:hypothetical protein